ncbi:multicopper oxidase domain-containing protein [Streptomyces echinatus]|uniref:multicopper oxidase domain-containing protein n=1 Tax=Streptomyces echinatus TaxID=67293 RepID=UPI0037B83F78
MPRRTDGRPQATTEPGREGVEPNKDVAALPAWVVTRLHGAQTGGGNDGWTDNGVGHGDARLSEYPNDHQAVQWWYHDHAMNITRWPVMTGLYGTYLVRDDEEDALRLPSGDREIPLLVADRRQRRRSAAAPGAGRLRRGTARPDRRAGRALRPAGRLPPAGRPYPAAGEQGRQPARGSARSGR